uniref:hypothetical protein n=1 Tax=Phaeostrophion irregulare TaxID=243268 RepID=UPI002E788593|nr:hypothetical protein V2492_pgp020 [Phaeostrophion irregulare]WAM64366.1 hypothetical protein [Phaeostrophion irregulare]
MMDKSKLNESQQVKWGFYLFSEVLNGRLAMVALPIIIIIEILTKKTITNILQI